MKILKRFLLGLAGLILLLLVVALFVKRDYKVERDIAINKPKDQVFDYVKHTRNHDQFNQWILADPQIQKTYRGNDGTVGFVYAWNSVGSAGKGEQEIRSIREGEQVDFDLRFIEPFEGEAVAHMITKSIAGNQTKLTWSMEGRSNYPFNLMNLFVPSVLGKDLSTSLQTLKTVLEKQ